MPAGSLSSAVLIVGPSWVGDAVLVHCLVQRLRDRDPALSVDVLAPPWTLPVLARMDGVRQAIPAAVRHGRLGLAERLRLARGLAGAGYRRAIVLPNSFKSALVPWLARIPVRTGFRGEMRFGLINDMRPLDEQRHPTTAARFAALAGERDDGMNGAVPSPHLAPRPDRLSVALHRLRLERADAELLALCPGAEYGPAKRWPAEYFAAVARDRLAAGWQVWIFGSARDREAAAAVAALAPGCTNLAGVTELDEAIDLLSLASVMVTNDSGLMHVAAALGRPVVALFGSSSPAHTPPMSEHSFVEYLALSCSPCFRRSCPLGHLRCLRDISPRQVLADIDRLMAADPAGCA